MPKKQQNDPWMDVEQIIPTFSLVSPGSVFGLAIIHLVYVQLRLGVCHLMEIKCYKSKSTLDYIIQSFCVAYIIYTVVTSKCVTFSINHYRV